MRVGKSGGAKGVGGKAPARRGGEFSVPAGPERASGVAAAAGVDPAGGLDLAGSLLAIEDRRRAIERGKASLDCLDQLRLDILEGEVSPATASRLAKLVDEAGGESLDPELRETVEEIRFRLRFEAARLAKGGRRGAGG